MFLVIHFRYIYKNIDLPWIKGKTGAQHRKFESSEEKKTLLYGTWFVTEDIAGKWGEK